MIEIASSYYTAFFFLNIITFLNSASVLMILSSKEAKTRYDYITIITRLGKIVFLIFIGVGVLGKETFDIPNYNEIRVNQYVCSLFFIYFPILLLTNNIEMNSSYIDAFNIIDYLLKKKPSVWIDMFFVGLVSIPAIIYEILLGSESTKWIIRNISIDCLTFSDDAKSPFMLIMFNPFVIILFLLMLILGGFELSNFRYISNEIKIRKNHSSIVSHLKKLQVGLLLLISFYLVVTLLIWTNAGQLRTNNNVLQFCFTIFVYVFLLFEGFFMLLVQCNSDYFYYHFGLTSFGQCLKSILCIPVDIRLPFRNKENGDENLNTMEPDECMNHIKNTTGFTFETHEIGILNSYMDILFRSIIIITTQLSSKHYSNNGDSFAKEEEFLEKRLNLVGSKRKERGENLFQAEYTLAELLSIQFTSDGHNLCDSSIANSNFNADENPYVTTMGLKDDLNYKERLHETKAETPSIKINSIFHKKLLISLHDNMETINKEIEELTSSLIEHTKSNPNFLVYLMSKTHLNDNLNKLYKNLKFSISNNKYVIQLVDDESAFIRYIENYINYRPKFKGQLTFLEDIISVYQFQIKCFPSKFIVITKNKFLAPSLLPQEYYHMWQIVKLCSNRTKKNTFKIMGSSKPITNQRYSDATTKPEKAQVTRSEYSDVQNSFNTNFVTDPNEMVFDIHHFELPRFTKFTEQLNRDLVFLQKQNITDFSLSILFYELEKLKEEESLANKNVGVVIPNFSISGVNQTANKVTGKSILGKSLNMNKFTQKLCNLSRNFSKIHDNNPHLEDSFEEDEFIKALNDRTVMNVDLPCNAFAAKLADYRCMMFFSLDVHEFSDNLICSIDKKAPNISQSRKISLCYSTSHNKNLAFQIYEFIFCKSTCRGKIHHNFSNMIHHKITGINYDINDSG